MVNGATAETCRPRASDRQDGGRAYAVSERDRYRKEEDEEREKERERERERKNKRESRRECSSARRHVAK